MKKSLLIAAVTLISASSIFAQGPTSATQMVNEEFGVIVKELELEPLQMHHLSKILEKKASEVIPIKNQIIALEERRSVMGNSDPKASAYIENELTNLRARIKQIHEDADDSITEHLNEEQVAKYFDEVKPTFEEKRKVSVNRSDSAKK